MRHRPRRLRRARCRCPAAYIEDDLLPAPAAMVSGRRRTEVHISARFARRGRKVLPPPRDRRQRPARPGHPRGRPPRSPPSCSSCRAWRRCVTPPGEGDGSGLAARRGRPSIAAEVDLDGLRPLPARRAGVAHLLAGAGARRRAHGAPPALRRRHAPARRARPAPARRARRTSTPPCAPPPRCACTWPAPAAARCCCPATGARRCSSPTLDRLAAPARAPGAGRRPRRAQRGRPGLAPRARCSTSPPTIRRARRARWATPSAAGAS